MVELVDMRRQSAAAKEPRGGSAPIAVLAEHGHEAFVANGHAAGAPAPARMSTLILVRPSLYAYAESAVDKHGQALPAGVVGDDTYWRTLRRIGAAAEASCAYVDGSGARCPRTCSGRVLFVDGLPYCFRHSAIAEAIAMRRGTVYEISPPPDVDDRGFNLLITLLKETSPRVLALLHNRFHSRRASIAADKQPRRIRLAAGLEWEQGWWATADRPLTRVALRVSAGYLPEVTVMVDHARRFTSVPDWASIRSPAGRHALWHSVVDAVRRAVDESDGRPSWAS